MTERHRSVAEHSEQRRIDRHLRSAALDLGRAADVARSLGGLAGAEGLAKRVKDLADKVNNEIRAARALGSAAAVPEPAESA